MASRSPLLSLLAAALYVGFVVAWVLTKRRLRLAGPGAPPRSALTPPEHYARRSLRALLAFDFLVIFPSSLLVAVVGVMGAGQEAIALALLEALFFGLPILYLLRQVRRHDRRRAEGRPPETVAELRSVGHAGLDALLGGRAWATTGAAAAIVVVSVLALLLPRDLLAAHLLKVNEAVLRGEVWRLLTVALVHANLFHLLLNVLVLVQVGRPLERLAGARAFLTVLAVGTVAGSLASVAFVPLPSVGASGGVFAVAGALVAFGWRHRAALPDGFRRKIIRATTQFLAVNLLITFALPFVDWAAHVGGLLAGAAIGWALGPSAALRAALAPPPPSPAPPPLPPR